MHGLDSSETPALSERPGLAFFSIGIPVQALTLTVSFVKKFSMQPEQFLLSFPLGE